MTSFILMAFLPLSLPFFLFFFLNIHFLQMQKQHANTRMIATNAIDTMAHDGTEKGKEVLFGRTQTLQHLTEPGQSSF